MIHKQVFFPQRSQTDLAVNQEEALLIHDLEKAIMWKLAFVFKGGHLLLPESGGF